MRRYPHLPEYVFAEAGDSAFAPALRKLLKRACGIGRRRPELADATLRTYAYALNAKLDALLRLTPTHAAGTTGCSGGTSFAGSGYAIERSRSGDGGSSAYRLTRPNQPGA